MLLQLMVYAKIIYLLMVVISGALCTVEDYVIMSQCAHNKAINLAAEGTVSVTDISQTQNITIVGRPDFVNNNFKIALYAKETQRYLCFNDHWKLVGMKELQDTCYFNEAIVHGYFVFRSVVDLQRRIGFTQRGRAVGPKKVVNDACYMFTKIPTDQFFHQHSHFPAPKAKSTTTTTTTTRIPKTEYTITPNYSSNAGRGSGGGGRTKTNRFRNSQRKDEFLNHNHSGHGSGHGSGGGSGSGNGHKKYKKQRNGNKLQRRLQQQQHRQEMQQQQQQIRGHSYNLSNPKNSTYLNSSRQNLVLSQHSHTNNHTNNKKHNNNSNPPQNHQVRHHHNDPNKVARRQQHDQKQKQIKLRQRVRPSPAATTPNETSVVTAAISKTTTTTSTTIQTPTTTQTLNKAINSSKPHTTQSSTYTDINPTSVVAPTLTTDNQSDSRNTMASSSVVVAKRKGRRRKGDKIHKKNLIKLKEHEQERDFTREPTEKDQFYSSSSIGPNYEEDTEEEYMTSSTDYAWMTNDIMMSSVKPTSASLPSWDTWYPSSTTVNAEENTEYSSAASVTEENNNKHFSTTLASSSMTDLDRNTLTAQTQQQQHYHQQQTSIPLPTAELTTTLMENSIDETISPTITTDLGMTTTNTSTYTQTDYWSTSLKEDNMEADLENNNGFTRTTSNTYATPQLEDTPSPTLNTEQALSWQDTNTLSTHNTKNELHEDEENSTTVINRTTTDEGEVEDNEFEDEKTSEASSSATSSTMWLEGSTSEITASSDDFDKLSEPTADTTTAQTNDCAYSTTSINNGSKTVTDCSKVATNILAPIANKHKQIEIPTTQITKLYHENNNKHLNTETMAITFPETTKTTLSLQPLKSLQEATSLHFLQPLQNNVGEQTESSSDLTTTLHSTKSPSPTVLTTRKTLRKSTQRLLATPFHQLTYVRNEAGDIDIDSIDNISIYPEILDNDNDEPMVRPSTSRLTMISGYLPTSATATLPESIRIAKIKINRERKRMLRIRNVGNYA